MTINVELLERELLWLLDHPQRHDQGVWVAPYGLVADGDLLRPAVQACVDARAGTDDWHCGTTACLAGWVAIHAGWQPLPAEVGLGRTTLLTHRDRPSHVALPVELIALRELNLDEDESTWLFAPENSLRDLFQIAHELTNGRIEVPVERFDEDGRALPVESNRSSAPTETLGCAVGASA